MIGIHTNVLIRHLVQDDPAQARIATRVMTTQCSREDPGFINRIVLCELVWVLESAYGYSKETIVGVLDKILRTTQLKVEDSQTAWKALRQYQKGKADFADCLLGSSNQLAGCAETITFDHEAGKLDEFRQV